MSTGFTTSVDASQYVRVAPDSSPASDARNIALTVGGRLVQAASQAIVLVLMARIAGTSETAGFIWAMALAAPVFMFTNMNLADLISTETPHGHSVRDYWNARLISTVAGLALLTAIVPLVSPSYQWAIIAAVAAGKALEALNDLILGAYHRAQRADRAAVSLVLRSVGGCLSLATILALTSNVVAGLTAMVLFHFSSLVIYDMPYVRQFSRQNDSATLTTFARILSTAFPLGVVACLTSLSLNVPRYVVNVQLTDKSLAAFGCCASFLQVFTLVGVATQLALCPRLASRNAQSRRLMNEMIWRNVMVVGGVGVAMVAASHTWGAVALGFIYGRQYMEFSHVLTWLMVAGTFAAAKGFLASGLTTTRSTLPQAVIATAQFGSAAVGCLWLVPFHGVTAAAWAVTASSAISFVLHALWTVRVGQEGMKP